MKRRVRLLPYGPSRSARDLSRACDLIRIRLSGSKFRPRVGDLIINWGCSNLPESLEWFGVNGKFINHPTNVGIASSKLKTFQILSDGGICVPECTTDREVARRWFEDDVSVVCRSLDRGSAGRGIVLVRPSNKYAELPKARFYTRYVPKYDEYRIHVWDGKVLDTQQKRRRNGAEYDNQIRTSTNGWVFCREGVEAPEQVLTEAIRAVSVLGLDFGAVDIGWTRKTSTATVYEVNTAPGIEGTTLENYSRAVREVLECRGL